MPRSKASSALQSFKGPFICFLILAILVSMSSENVTATTITTEYECLLPNCNNILTKGFPLCTTCGTYHYTYPSQWKPPKQFNLQSQFIPLFDKTLYNSGYIDKIFPKLITEGGNDGFCTMIEFNKKWIQSQLYAEILQRTGNTDPLTYVFVFFFLYFFCIFFCVFLFVIFL